MSAGCILHAGRPGGERREEVVPVQEVLAGRVLRAPGPPLWLLPGETLHSPPNEPDSWLFTWSRHSSKCDLWSQERSARKLGRTSVLPQKHFQPDVLPVLWEAETRELHSAGGGRALQWAAVRHPHCCKMQTQWQGHHQ